jgi:streptomycin 6-kinase
LSRRAWDGARTAEECAHDWHLTLGARFPASLSAVFAVTSQDGTPAVLKVRHPADRESEHEAEALRSWNGAGAVRLLAHDSARRAMLVERCVPGTPLSSRRADDALDVLIGLLPRLWVPAAEPFTPVAEEAARWTRNLEGEWEAAGRPFERRLLDIALDLLRSLPASQGPQVLVHQDLHGDNVLAAEREPWLVIDPKPLLAEREFALAPILRSTELGHTRGDVLHRLERMTAELGLDRERARLWCVAQTIAWAFGPELIPTHLDTVRWLLEAA